MCQQHGTKPHVCPLLFPQVLEPTGDKNVAFKDWEKMGSQISELGLWDDDEQPLPTNVMYPVSSLACASWPGGERGERGAHLVDQEGGVM